MHYLAYLVVYEVSELQHVLPHPLQWFTYTGYALPPYVDRSLKIDQFTLTFVRLGVFNHIPAPLTALHNQLIQYQILEVYVV